MLQSCNVDHMSECSNSVQSDRVGRGVTQLVRCRSVHKVGPYRKAMTSQSMALRASWHSAQGSRDCVFSACHCASVVVTTRSCRPSEQASDAPAPETLPNARQGRDMQQATMFGTSASQTHTNTSNYPSLYQHNHTAAGTTSNDTIAVTFRRVLLTRRHDLSRRHRRHWSN